MTGAAQIGQHFAGGGVAQHMVGVPLGQQHLVLLGAHHAHGDLDARQALGGERRGHRHGQCHRGNAGVGPRVGFLVGRRASTVQGLHVVRQEKGGHVARSGKPGLALGTLFGFEGTVEAEGFVLGVAFAMADQVQHAPLRTGERERSNPAGRHAVHTHPVELQARTPHG
ncbi:MAG: hypothetical protein DCF26_21070 [Burkholderiales bacterium]|nr:MAG: hypothetical protein DCF26_21070 [Burkholderiales bacterium]